MRQPILHFPFAMAAKPQIEVHALYSELAGKVHTHNLR